MTESQPSLFDDGKDRPAAGHAVPVSAGSRDSGAALVARVQLEEGSSMELDYGIPDELQGRLQLGSRVRVPLQSRQVSAVVVELLRHSPHAAKLKPIAGLQSSRPMFTRGLLELAQWMAHYYLVPLHRVLRSMLPQAVRQKPESFLKDSLLELTAAATAEQIELLEKRAPQQAALLHALQRVGGSAALSALRREMGIDVAVLKALERRGLLQRSALRLERDPFGDEHFLPSQAFELTVEQAAALKATIQAIDAPQEHRPLLLQGVTGSGKTEVYLQAIDHALKRGLNALVLVPEISLTPQTIERFKARFHEMQQQVAVLHSHLSDGERHDEWFKVQEGRARIVIGARSALFAPLDKLGIIIVDEEHEPSYKQEEAPRYHARDLAVLRGRLEQCAVLLGSATPSLESFHNAQCGKYEWLHLSRRTDGRSMPLIRIIDMRLARRKGTGMKVEHAIMISEHLRNAVAARLEKGEQSILFLNRRGFHTTLDCGDCAQPVQCHDCAIPMTWHKAVNHLVCHICGARRLPPKICPACGQQNLKYGGFGTERVEAAVREIFPKARIARVDTDTMQRKNQLRDTLRDFRAQKLDLLIGTQMIAKGLDFPNVTLVGVLNADTALNLPDFRAAERTVQLLIQVAGRAGRGEMQGEVFVQTHAPHSPAIQFSRHSDYNGFATQELEARRAFEYPPFSHMVLISARGPQQNLAEFTLQTLHKRLQEGLPQGCVMGEPCPSSLVKAHGQFRYQLLLRSASIRPLLRHLSEVMRRFGGDPQVQLSLDVDPINLSA